MTGLIDGHDRLILTPASIRYEHLTYAGPGMETFRTESTALNVTLGSTVSDIVVPRLGKRVQHLRRQLR